MEPTKQEAQEEAQEVPHAAPDAAQDAAPEPKRRGRPPGSKNKPKQDVPTEPAAPKRKPKPPPVEAPAEAPAEAPGGTGCTGGASAHKRAAARAPHAGEAVRPAFDLVLRRIRSLKRCVQACGCKIMTPRYACNLAPGCISSEPTFAGLRKKQKTENKKGVSFGKA